MKKIDKVIKYFKENMVVGGMGPTNRVGDGGLTSKGIELAGYDKPLGSLFRRKRNGKVDYRSVKKQYKNWLKNLENK